MPTLIVQGQVIDFPNDSANPDWSEGIIAFAEAVTTALQGVAGTYDVSPQTFTLDSYNPGANVNIPLLTFPVSNVRSVIIYYSLYRSTSMSNTGDAGQIQMVYNPSNGGGMKWEVEREGTSATILMDDGVTYAAGGIVFSVSDTGQVSFTTNTLAGLSHNGILCYSAKALTYA